MILVYYIFIKIFIIEVYFESHLMYKWRYYRQIIFNQWNIIVSYVEIIGLCHSVAIFWEIYVMRPKCHVRWLRFHFNHYNCGTWSIDFDFYRPIRSRKFIIHQWQLNITFNYWFKASLYFVSLLYEHTLISYRL